MFADPEAEPQVANTTTELMNSVQCLLIRAETPLKDQYTLIERSNTLIEQSDHSATETRMRLDTTIKKELWEDFWEILERIIGKILHNRLKPN